VKQKTLLKLGSGGGLCAHTAFRVRSRAAGSAGRASGREEIAPFVKPACRPSDNFPAWICKMI